ncbi:cell division ATP-binding protein FtsE [Candidatus Phycosocius spiralis]|uniref:Cell division ATP-binding protein FtsE n=1 Tax=Candidatus Phycosocius spiralis TaxID=2815099 RepID=A0ABQ4PUW1_9PROT|nr:cell division ATP-binding protein FtsE [Candidatus Phycosocius spiralis]GIU66766.1 cell division ATP-binding protein FtsE [Candidatus Phycosocius spiralis]
MNHKTRTLGYRDGGPIVRFDKVGVTYGSGTQALRDVSFELESGGFYFLTGPSGAGKSTLLKLMYLALRPSVGQANLFGVNVGRASRNDLPLLRRKIGVVFQDFRLLPHLSVFENVAMPFRVRNVPLADYAEDVDDLLRWVGLGARIDALPETLSGGEQQRVAIARAVVGKPSLLIADEPTGNVDPDMGARIIRLFIELHKLGATVVIATHDLDLVRRSGAPVLRLEAGELTQAPNSSPLMKANL